VPDNRYKYCPECKDSTLKERAHKYYLTRKAKDPDREREFRRRSRAHVYKKVIKLTEAFKTKIPPEQCLICDGEEELLHHRYYKDEKEYNLGREGNWKGTVKQATKRLDNPTRYRILSYTTHKTLTGMLTITEEALDELYKFAKEEISLRKKYNKWLPPRKTCYKPKCPTTSSKDLVGVG